MIRTDCRPSPRMIGVVAIFAVVGFAPMRAWAGSSSTVPPAASAASAGDAAEAEEAAAKASHLMVLEDFNRDGIADIAEVTFPDGGHSGQAFLKVSLGQADGSFKPVATETMLGQNPRDIVAGDFNHDGIPDLIVGDDDGELLLFLGDGTGKLAAAGDIAHLESVVSIVVADLNHDGIPDLAVSDWRSSTVAILLGTGKGSFRSGWSFPLRMGGTTPHLAIADFNADGIPDLAVVYDNDDGDTYDVMLGNGNGTFTLAPKLSLIRDPNSHCAT